MNQQLVDLAIKEVPEMISVIKSLFVRENPDKPEPTDAQVVAAYRDALSSSEAKDDRWLAAHPKRDA